MVFLVDRNRNRVLRSPSFFESAKNRLTAYFAAFVLNPIGKAFRYSERGNFNSSASISHILRSCCPSAISRAIMTIGVYSVYFQLFSITVAHCPIVEHFVRGSPFVAHRNAAPAVIMKHSVIRVDATINHCIPAFIKLGARQTVPWSKNAFVFSASARFRFAFHQIAKINKFFCAAIASAQNGSPVMAVWKSAIRLQDGPSAKFLTNSRQLVHSDRF